MNTSTTNAVDSLFDSCTNPLVMFKIPGCMNCSKLCTILETLKQQCSEGSFTYQVIDLSDPDFEDSFDSIVEELCSLSENKRTFPKLFFNRSYIGGYEDLKRKYDFDGLQYLHRLMGIATTDALEF